MANIVNLTQRARKSRFLRPGDFFEITFVALAGPIQSHVDVFGLGPKIKVPGVFEKKPNGEEDIHRPAFQLEANVMIDVIDPDTLVPVLSTSINNIGKPITRKNTDGTQSHGESYFEVPDSGAGKRWIARFTNKGSKGNVQCNATVRFVKSRHREETTLIPLRVLNNALRQAVDTVGLGMRFDNGKLFIDTSPDLVELSGGKLGPVQFELGVDIHDPNLSPIQVRAGVRGSIALIEIFLQFETRGVEVDETFISVDLDKAACLVTIELRNEGVFAGTLHIHPFIKVETDVSGELDGLVGNFIEFSEGSLHDLVKKAEPMLNAFINSSEYVDVVGKYLTEVFTQSVAQNHVFNGIEGSGGNFLIRHFDPISQSSDDSGDAIISNVQPIMRDPLADLADKQVPKEDPESIKNLEKIDTIVVLMQENRSFDQVLGYLKNQGKRKDIDGLTGHEKNSMPGVTDVKVNALDSSIFRYSPEHGYDPVGRQIDADGGMSGFLASFVERFPTVDPSLAMAFHTAKHVPVYDQLAKEYLICDKWFAAHPGPTQPNRYCTLTGQTPILDNYNFGDPHLGFLPEATIFDLLTEANITWAYYESDIAFLRFFDRYRLDNKHVIPLWDPIDGFFSKAARGHLEQVVFIDPNFIDVPPKRTASDDTPPADMLSGQENIACIYDALVRSPNWSRTLFIITYDEHGGFYDHVAPPGTKLSKLRDYDFVRVHPQAKKDCLGVRVPAFIISPWVPKRSVSHIVFDHTSIVKTILVKFFGEKARDRMGRRALRAKNLGLLLTNRNARVDKPVINFGLCPPKPRTRKPETRNGLPSQPRIVPDEFHEAMRRFGVPTTLAK